MTEKRILAAVDLGEHSNAVLAAAKHAARGGKLAFSHVVPHLGPIKPLFPHLVAQEQYAFAELEKRAAAAARERIAAVTELAPDAYELFVDEGVDYAEIVKRADAWKATRLLVGATSHSTLAATFLGSVAERVIRAAPCPVQVVRTIPADGPVVVATDLSDPSMPALDEAVREAADRSAKLVVAYAIDFGDATLLNNALSPLIATSVIPQDAMDTARKLAHETIEAKLEALSARGEVVVLDGAAAPSIVRLAAQRNAALIVVGTHGRTGLKRLALGSVAERVARTAPCDVLAVRLPG